MQSPMIFGASMSSTEYNFHSDFVLIKASDVGKNVSKRFYFYYARLEGYIPEFNGIVDGKR
jgi:hypothetical protein